MAGIGKYTEGKKFTLKSGNTTPFKKMGSSPAKQRVHSDSWLTEHGKKLVKEARIKEAQAKMPKNFNIKGGPSTTPGYSTTKIAKNPASTLGRTTKAMQNVPKQFTKVTTTNLKSAGKQFATKAKGLGQGKLGKVVTKVAKKGVGRLAGGTAGVLAGLAYEAYKSGKKHSGGKAGSKEGQAKWKAQKEKAPKSDIWGKNK